MPFGVRLEGGAFSGVRFEVGGNTDGGSQGSDKGRNCRLSEIGCRRSEVGKNRGEMDDRCAREMDERDQRAEVRGKGKGEGIRQEVGGRKKPREDGGSLRSGEGRKGSEIGSRMSEDGKNRGKMEDRCAWERDEWGGRDVYDLMLCSKRDRAR